MEWYGDRILGTRTLWSSYARSSSDWQVQLLFTSIWKHESFMFWNWSVFFWKNLTQPICFLVPSTTNYKGIAGCRNVKKGGDTAKGMDTSDPSMYMTYIVYRSFKYPPEIQAQMRKPTWSAGQLKKGVCGFLFCQRCVSVYTWYESQIFWNYLMH